MEKEDPIAVKRKTIKVVSRKKEPKFGSFLFAHLLLNNFFILSKIDGLVFQNESIEIWVPSFKYDRKAESKLSFEIIPSFTKDR